MLAAHRAFLATALLCAVVFGWMLTFGTFQFVAEDSFGSFYDHQAEAWLHGRWDVPEPALGGEAFIVEGKVYGYFGPTPAVMRLPFVALGVGFASLTRSLMLVDYLACLAGAYALLCLAAQWRAAGARPTTFATVVFTATVGLGNTLFFVGSRAYVYHEAILCGAAFALWGVVFALRHLREPLGRWWMGSLVCGVLAVQARAPIGLFALTVLGCVALFGLVQGFRGAPRAGVRRPLIIGVLSVVGVLSFNLVSYVKFGTIEGCPLRFNVQYTPEKLAVLGHRNFHVSNLRFNTDAYLLRPSFSLNAHFPYVYREYIDRTRYPESRMAYRDPTLAMPWSMPGLIALAFAGSLLSLAAAPALGLPLAVLWLAAIPAALAMLTAVAVTQRYTADFCPFLIAAAAFGIVAVEALPGAIFRLVRAALVVFAVLGAAVTFALTLHHQREIVWGVPAEVQQEYQRWRAAVDQFFTTPDGATAAVDKR